jgi:hypothetical protein
LFFYWVVLFRRVFSMSEVPLTYTTYCVSSLKQFFFLFFILLYFHIIKFFIALLKISNWIFFFIRI